MKRKNTKCNQSREFAVLSGNNLYASSENINLSILDHILANPAPMGSPRMIPMPPIVNFDEMDEADREIIRAGDQQAVDSLLQVKAKNVLKKPKDPEKVFAEYLVQREQISTFHTDTMKATFKSMIVNVSKELENFDYAAEKPYIHNESETNAYYDYYMLYRKQGDQRFVDEWLLKHPEVISTKNEKVINAYTHSSFAALYLGEHLEGYHIKATDLISGKAVYLVDRALYRSNKQGLIFACSLLDMGNYAMTSGGGMLLDPKSPAGRAALTLVSKHLNALKEKSDGFFDAVKDVFGFCLRGGALVNMSIN